MHFCHNGRVGTGPGRRARQRGPAEGRCGGISGEGVECMQIRSKLWVEIDGEPVFGRGRRFLLEAIDRYGSINQASKEINISYRKAWSYINVMEERLGLKLVDRQAGGKNGGGATLTDEAREFIKRYERMEDGIRDIVDEKFNEIFGKKDEKTVRPAETTGR